MARPRTFDPDKVLDTARAVFWTKGYQATSLDDITAVTGLTKPSLYGAFGDKASLFHKVLERYHDLVVARSAAKLAEGNSARDAIRRWLESLLPVCTGVEGRRGCLSVNTSTDGSLDDAELKQSLARFNGRLEGLILARLQTDRAQFPDAFDPLAATYAIMTVYVGLMAQAKQAQSIERAKAVVDQAIRLLG